MDITRRSFEHRITNLLLKLGLLGVIIIVLFPVIWMIPAAFKPRREVFSIPARFFPEEGTLDNFRKLFNPAFYDNWNFFHSFVATLSVAVVGVIIGLFINMLTAYVFARMEFRFKKWLWIFFIFSMFVPAITILMTSFRVVAWLGMLDSFAVLVLPGVLTSYNIFFFRQFFLGVPVALEEAAVLDGASRFKIFISIFVPLSKAPMVIVGATLFMGYWNSFLWPTLTITNNTRLMQIMQVIRILNERYANDYGVVIAATILSLIGPLIMFALAQKKIMEGVVLTGIK